jgi:hypothetical protein
MTNASLQTSVSSSAHSRVSLPSGAGFAGPREWPLATTQLWGPVAPGWRIEHPLELAVERDDDGSFIVSDELFFLYGHGRSWDDARQDYVSVLLEYRELMGRSQDELTQAIARHLDTYLQRP